MVMTSGMNLGMSLVMPKDSMMDLQMESKTATNSAA